jgi:acetyl esterase/lipase
VDAGYSDSNWEEDGERCFSVRRAIDWLLAQANVRQDRLFMAGLSMGGEVTTITSALDPRIGMGLVAGFSPDMHVMDVQGNHPCYLWDHADIHEYLDVSDWHALIAPRPLLVETGKVDHTFSPSNPPYAADKQVTRRGRAAYGSSAPSLVHYLHYDQHAFHVGGGNPTHPDRPRGVLAAVVTNPVVPGDQTWQTDGATVLRSPTVYDLMNEFLPP